MKRSRVLLSLAALLVIGLGVVAYRSVRTPAAAPAAEDTAAPAGAAAASTELAELRQQLTRLQAQIRAQGPRPAAPDPAAAPASDPPAVPDHRADPEALAEVERRHREHVAGVDAEFRREATDPRWSSATLAAIQAALATDDDLRPLVRSVECRSRMCRIEIADDGSGKLGQSLPAFVHQLGRDLPTLVGDRVEDDRGGAKTILYMSRDEAAVATVTAP